jgi:protein TonB
MFDQTFVEAAQRDKKPVTIVFSLALQGFMICLLILMRLVYTESMPEAVIKSLLLAPAPPPAAVPEPHTSKAQLRSTTRTLNLRKFFAPVVIPKNIPASVQDAPPAPDITGVVGSTGDANGSGVIGSIIGSAPPAPSAPPAEAQPKKQPAHKPVPLGGRVAEANLIHKVMPAYPPLARSTRVQGTVEFTALISKEGRIENLQLVHGHPLLVNAAREAVLQWRYRPTLLNGEPVEVITDIVVNFTLAQ